MPGPFPVLRHFGFSSVIFLYRLRSPFIAFFLVAHGTGIRTPQLYAQQRIRIIERMFPAGVPSHIQACLLYTSWTPARASGRIAPHHAWRSGFSNPGSPSSKAPLHKSRSCRTGRRQRHVQERMAIFLSGYLLVIYFSYPLFSTNRLLYSRISSIIV